MAGITETIARLDDKIRNHTHVKHELEWQINVGGDTNNANAFKTQAIRMKGFCRYLGCS